MHILFLSRWFPYPVTNGSKLRIYQLLTGLAAHHEVTLVSFADEAGLDPAPPQLRALCKIAHVVPWKPFTPRSWPARFGFLQMAPRSVVASYSPQMAHAIVQTLAQQPFDLVIASQLATAGYVRYFGQTPALFEEVEVGVLHEPYRQAATFKRRLRHSLTWFKHRHYLAQVLRQFCACTVASPRERDLVRAVQSRSAAIEVIPNCVTLADYAALETVPQPATLIFTGSFRYFANYEAMCWFVQEVLPLVQAQCPETALTITGDSANQPLPPARRHDAAGQIIDARQARQLIGRCIAGQSPATSHHPYATARLKPLLQLLRPIQQLPGVHRSNGSMDNEERGRFVGSYFAHFKGQKRVH